MLITATTRWCPWDVAVNKSDVQWTAASFR